MPVLLLPAAEWPGNSRRRDCRLMAPPLPSLGVSIGTERERHQNRQGVPGNRFRPGIHDGMIPVAADSSSCAREPILAVG